MRESLRKGEFKLSDLNDYDFSTLLIESIHNSDVGFVNKLIEERVLFAFKFTDDSLMTSIYHNN